MASRHPALTVADHDRSTAGLRYVYPVVSRRAGGVSVGINLNTNNACNWRCIYCQVPGLARGAPPPVDLDVLESELRSFLTEVLQGDFLQRRVAADSRRLNDIALSGNGEPTSAAQFGEVVKLIGRVRAELQVPLEVKTVLITNGSLVHRKNVQAGIGHLRELNGEVWFKIDRATEAGIRAVNDSRVGLKRVQENLATAARACATWIQTCVFALDGKAPAESEQLQYLDFLRRCLDARIPIRGVLLYGLARKSYQPEASRLSALSGQWMESYAERIRALGVSVKVTP
jgi:wyosine [tRNA(Phe)-imidazoG37] synthetase (radical SAM superfamily)